MPSPILRDQLRRLQRENEQLHSSLKESAIAEAIAKTAAWYLFDVARANNLDKNVKVALERWPFLDGERETLDH